MTTVTFACVHNAGRSQMAAAFYNKLADPAKARALSAGATPGDRVHPEVVAVMQEEGIDLSDARPKRMSNHDCELTTPDRIRRLRIGNPGSLT